MFPLPGSGCLSDRRHDYTPEVSLAWPALSHRQGLSLRQRQKIVEALLWFECFRISQGTHDAFTALRTWDSWLASRAHQLFSAGLRCEHDLIRGSLDEE